MAQLSYPAPKSDTHNQVKVTARSANWCSETSLDDSFREFVIDVPAHVNLDDVEVVAVFVDASGSPAVDPMVLKPRIEKPKVEPKPIKIDPKPEFAAKPEPKPEPKVEPKH